jgi:hypothetical protein
MIWIAVIGGELGCVVGYLLTMRHMARQIEQGHRKHLAQLEAEDREHARISANEFLAYAEQITGEKYDRY